ncbi:MAG: FxsA family protein [Halocynthiibacter sp.]
MWLFLIFLAVPLIEIGLFIQVVGAIGLWPTLATVVLTAAFGTWLVRAQGLRALTELRGSFSELRDPTEPLAHGAMILFAGALLLTPGFFTDSVGFLLLVPPIRTAVFRYLRQRVTMRQFSAEARGGQRPDNPHPYDAGVIDAEYEDVTPEKRPTRRPSGWTQH